MQLLRQKAIFALKIILEKGFVKWLLFFALSIIWGSSFILMKAGLKALNPYQVATIRLLSAGVVLAPFAFKAMRVVEKNKLKYIFLAALAGSFFPAYLYCIAETKIDSSLAAILNALTPFFTILMSIVFFNNKPGLKNLLGILIGFAGLVLLPFAANKGIGETGMAFSILVLVATVLYAVNGNIAARHLSGENPLYVTSIAFGFLILPCSVILIASGFFQINFKQNTQALHAVFAALLLGIGGSALAYVFFYMLVKRARAIFASLVT